MVYLLALFGALFSTHIIRTYAGGCPPFCHKYDEEDPLPPARPVPMGQYPTRPVCRKSPPSNGKWACEDPNIIFPTVDCILADMKLCGYLGKNSVFKSFGAEVPEISATFLDKLTPRGVVFNEALDDKVRSPFFPDIISSVII